MPAGSGANGGGGGWPTRFGNPALERMLKDMAKQRADATKANAKGSKGRSASEGDIARATGMRESGAANVLNMLADDLLYRAVQGYRTNGDPHWDRGARPAYARDNAAGANPGDIDPQRFADMGPDWLRKPRKP